MAVVLADVVERGAQLGALPLGEVAHLGAAGAGLGEEARRDSVVTNVVPQKSKGSRARMHSKR